MPIDVPLPSYSENMEGADVIGWLVAPGDHVSEGDPIAEIETDKATGELESPVSGVLVEICVAEGTADVKVGTVVARIEPAEEPAEAPDPAAAPEPTPDTAAAPVPAPPPSEPAEAESIPTPGPPEAAPGAEAESHVESDMEEQADTESESATQSESSASLEPATPENDELQSSSTPQVASTALARRLADQHGVDLQTLTGTGLRGRITKADVQAAHETGEPVAATGTARSDTVATLETPCAIGRAQEVCEQLAQRESLEEFPLAAVLVRSAAMASEEFPEVTGDASTAETAGSIRLEQTLCDAAGLPALRVRVIEGAERKSLAVISEELESGSEPEGSESSTGEFRMIDLGGFEVERVQAPLESSSAACLAVGAPTPRLVPADGPGGGGRFVQIVHCSLTVDTRAISIHAAARWLQNFRRRVEDPLEMLL